MADEEGDQLPADLDVTGYVGPYRFPDNSRRRAQGLIYLVAAAGCLVIWLLWHEGGVLVNDGFLVISLVLAGSGAYHIAAGQPLGVRETEALIAASKQVGFPVGHASAQLAWRGLLSRPTWRILLYSAEDPPAKRALVLVDGVDGGIVAHLVEDNPEPSALWSLTLDR